MMTHKVTFYNYFEKNLGIVIVIDSISRLYTVLLPV